MDEMYEGFEQFLLEDGHKSNELGASLFWNPHLI
ncbi:hypothetical protein BVRB_5g101030 [Beta vulgaris subsp. vulgaris]|nr:hypothetical protein BVRB_5g101030 [Beta vulgaris subsp. vulgaris]